MNCLKKQIRIYIVNISVAIYSYIVQLKCDVYLFDLRMYDSYTSVF